jgi:hypothetical protein
MVFSRIYLHLCGILLPVFYFGCFLIGCAGLRQMQMPQLPDNLPSAFELEAVPFYPQEDYQCGPATLAMALSFSLIQFLRKSLPVIP